MFDIVEEAKKWLMEHEHYEHEPSFSDDLKSLSELLTQAAISQEYILFPGEVGYDASFGDNKECECGHVYYRHFDPYEGMAPVGCKYCHPYGDKHGNNCCPGFKEKK